MKKIAIFGAGGFGREVAMLIEQINKVDQEWEIIGFFDDGIEKNKMINNYPVLGGIAELNMVNEGLYLVLSIGNPSTKTKILNQIINDKIKYPVIVHPNVQIGDSDVKIGEGSIITAGCVITTNISIGKHVILNLSCTVGHDTIIDDYSAFMPSVNISGEVKIENSVYVGTGAKIINLVTIGARTIIGAGAVVAKNIPSDCTAVGIPAKPIKFHE
ncbi:MAG: acetyltransferase [Bacteroidetes bacterium]|nr:acetyltransferase [Bacteroidota bacterium]